MEISHFWLMQTESRYCGKMIEDKNMSDLIDRQAVLDALEKSKKQYFDRRLIIGKMQDIVNSLPSAEPLVLTCDGCRHVGTYDTDFPCSGCIRREKDYYEQER